MPMSDFVLSSTVLSSTRFMNWSKPRSVPVTCRLALSATAEGDEKDPQLKTLGAWHAHRRRFQHRRLAREKIVDNGEVETLQQGEHRHLRGG
jgi:hypothetical protein